MATPAAVLSIIVEANTGKAEAALKEFQRNLSKADREKAEATLAYEVEKGGYNVFSGLVAKADATRADAELGFDVDKSGLARARASQALLTKESSALTNIWNRNTLSIGQWTTIIGASLPVVFDLVGALGALTASLGAATVGLGALGVGAGGALTVGIAGIVSVAAPAIASLGDLKTAQDAYTEAVERYGEGSTQAATALTKLTFEQKRAGPLATALAENLATLTRRWKALTKAGQTDFIGTLNDGVTRLNRKLPMLAESANRSVKALGVGFDIFLDRATGPEFNHFIHVMTVTFARAVKPLAGAFGDIAKVLQRIAVAVAPDIVRMAKGFEDMTQGWVDSTRNAGKLREVIHGLVNQANAWWKLIKATGELIVAVLVPGMGQGKRAVEGITETIKGWTAWVRGHPDEMKNFFKKGLETTKQLAQALLSFAPTLAEISEAMRPIARAFLALVKALNTLKIGSVSALTVLLGAIVGTKVVKGVVGMTAAFNRLKVAALGAAAAEKVAMLVPARKAAVPAATTVAQAPFGGPMPTTIPKGALQTTSLLKFAKAAGVVGLAVTTVAGAFLALRDNFLGIRDVFTGFFEKVLKPLGDAFTDLVDQLSGGHAAEVFGAIGSAIEAISRPMGWLIKNLTKLMGLFAIGAIAQPFIVGLTLIAAPIWVAVKATTLFVKALKAFVGFIRQGAWDKLAHLLGAPFRAAWDVAKKVVGLIRDGIKGLIDWIKSNWIGSKLDLGAPFRAMWNIAKRAFDFVRDKAGVVVGWIKDRWGSITHTLTAPFRAMKRVAKDVFGWIKGQVQSVIDKVQGVIDKFESIKDIPGKAAGGVKGAVEGAAGGVKDFILGGQRGGLVTAQGVIPQGFQAGGVVGKRGLKPGPRDTIPAMLEVGELVIPKEMVDKTRKNAKLTAAVMTGELGKGHKEAAKDTDKFVKNHGKAWDGLRSATAKTTERFRKGTVDDFQKTSKEGERATDQMRGKVSDGFGKMRSNATESSGRMKQGVSEDFRSLTGAVGDGLRKIGSMTNSALKALGVKKVDFNIGVKGRQRGGHIDVAGAPPKGDHIPALLEKGEFVVNQKATQKHRDTLEKINRDPQRFQTGGVVDRTGVQRFAKGGAVGGGLNFALGPYDIPPIQYAADHAGSNSHVHVTGTTTPWVVALGRKLQGMGFMVGEHPAFGGVNFQHSATGGHYDALAIDINSAADETRAEVSRIARLLKTGAAGGAAAVEKIARVLLKGPDGPLKDLGQASLDKVHQAANEFLAKQTPMGVAPDAKVGKGVLSRAEMRRLLRANNLPDIMGWVAGAESLWNPSAHNASGASGLWQIMMPLHQGIVRGNVFDPNVNARAAATLYGQSGLTPWAESKYKGAIPGGWSTKVGASFQRGGITAPYVGSFDKGGTVAETGLGLLHEGERVFQKGGVIEMPKGLQRLINQAYPHRREHQRHQRQREEARRGGFEAGGGGVVGVSPQQERRQREASQRDANKELVAELRELRKDVKEHNTLYKTLRRADKQALAALVDLTSAQIGAQGLQKTRLAGWGVDRRY